MRKLAEPKLREIFKTLTAEPLNFIRQSIVSNVWRLRFRDLHQTVLLDLCKSEIFFIPGEITTSGRSDQWVHAISEWLTAVRLTLSELEHVSRSPLVYRTMFARGEGAENVPLRSTLVWMNAKGARRTPSYNQPLSK